MTEGRSERLELATGAKHEAIRVPASLMQAVQDLSVGALRIVLCLGLASSLVAASLAAAGGAPPGTVAVGGLLILVWLTASLAPERTARLLLPSGSTIAPAVTLATAIAVTGPWHSPYEGVAYPLVGVAVVTERPRWVARCLGVLVGGYLTGLLITGHSVDSLAAPDHLYGEVNNIGDLVLFGGVMLLVVWVLRSTLVQAPELLEEARWTGAGMTPALGAQLRRAAGLLEPAPARRLVERLTASELNVVVLLAQGLTAKQVAYQDGRSLATVRSQIAAAKRTTGARTIEQLIAFYMEAQPHLS